MGVAMKLPLPVVSIGVALFLAAVSALALVEVPQGAEPAQAVHAGGVDKMSIDMDPAGTPANTPTSIGTTETCAVIYCSGIISVPGVRTRHSTADIRYSTSAYTTTADARPPTFDVRGKSCAERC